MHDNASEPPSGDLTIDAFSAHLARLRLEAGNPSYAEVATRIARARERAGLTAERARIARSTVYDVFRPGRRRLDGTLVREILVALDLDEAGVEAWTAAARRAVPGAVPAPVPDPGPVARPEAESAEGALPSTPPEPPQPVIPLHLARPLTQIAKVVIACVALNLVGRSLVVVLGLPLHLDMIGTATSAILLGPWWGALVGVLTNVIGAVVSGPASFPFVLVNVTGALVWGYGVHRFGMGRSITAFFQLSVIAAVACSLVATPILLVMFGGELGHASDGVTDELLALTHVLALSVFLSNLITSLTDKTISGFAALAIVEARSGSNQLPSRGR